MLFRSPSGQAYLGCKFPAVPEYGPAIMREALKVGHRLKQEGVLGRFALDFVAVLLWKSGFGPIVRPTTTTTTVPRTTSTTGGN